MPLKATCLQPYQVPAASLSCCLLPHSMIGVSYHSANLCLVNQKLLFLIYVQAPCLELPLVHVCSPLMSSGHACKQMPPGMLCPVQSAHYARLCRKKVSG